MFSGKREAHKKEAPPAEYLIDFLRRPASLYPDKACLRFRRGNSDCEVSYSEFLSLTEALSAALLSFGLVGAHIAILGEKSPEWISAYFAIVNAGGVAVPLDAELDRAQLAGFIDFADCEALFYSEKFAEAVEERRADMPRIKRFIKIENAPLPLAPASAEASGATVTYRAAVAAGRGLMAKGGVIFPKTDADAMCAVIFTSGTTGTSKGVMLSQHNFVFCVRKSLELTSITSDDVLVSLLPLHHTYEMTAGIMLSMFIGSTICLNDSVTNALRDLKYYRPTMLALVPLFVNTIYKRIISTAQKQGSDKKLAAAIGVSGVLRIAGVDLRKILFGEVLSAFGGRLHTIICGGAALNPALVARFDEFGIALKQGYGITECSPIISVVPPDVNRPASCGKPIAGLQVMIDRDGASDAAGEIMVKGESVMLGYYKNPEATARVLTDRGWFYTGDCGYLDSEGFLYITGRRKNVIVLENGKNVFPEEIEEYLERIPLISECVVVGRTAPDGTVTLAALIYPDPEAAAEKGLTDDAAAQAFFKDEITALNKTLPSFKQIRSVELRKTPFPKTTSKKIIRYKV